jgi:putative tricarboxylic transport membrane protein
MGEEASVLDSPDDAGHAQGARSGRITAVILLAFAVILAIATSQIEYAFSSDPLGPRAFPYILSAALAICSVWYLLRPGAADPWPHSQMLISAFALIAVTAIAIGLMDHIGFLPAAFVMCSCAAYLFGASVPAAIGIGAVQAAFWFALFKYGLGTYLPAGTLLFPG